MKAANSNLDYEEVVLGKEVFESGHTSGIKPESWDVIRRNQILLKAPITTPQGGGYKSLNVTLRKSLAMYANVRPCIAYTPYVESNHPEMDMVIVRENEEDLYAGIEHQQTNEVVQCLKLITRPGCENVIRYAFEYAKVHGRKSVTCMVKDNIMKHTDGLFHEVFDEIAKAYPQIESDVRIIDIGAAEMATKPENFDVVVTLNLYGDIVSDIAAQLAGSVGLGGSANIGKECSMFEAIHGSAPDIAGQHSANPSGLLNAAIMMLNHVGDTEAATNISNAWLKTLEDGIHTPDIYRQDLSKQYVGTQDFADAVVERLGQKPETLKPEDAGVKEDVIKLKDPAVISGNKELVGVDVFIDWTGEDRNPDEIGKKLEALGGLHLKLKMITNRGVKVYPGGYPETFSTDHWRCRFVAKNETITHEEVVNLLQRLDEAGFDFIKTEHLYKIDGERAYSLGQGE